MGLLSSDPRPVVACDPGEDMAKQSFKEECDINGIVRRFQKTGLMTHLARGVPQFVDAAGLPDYQETLNRLAKAREFFAGLPSNIRKEFDNNAATFLDAVSDPLQEERLRNLGLQEVVEAQKPSPAPPVTPPEAPAPPTPPEPAPAE